MGAKIEGIGSNLLTIHGVESLHGTDIRSDRHYVRMVNSKAFDRVSGYMQDGTVIYGGECDRETKFIAPTLIANVQSDSPVMTEEIFGPVFPIIEFGGNESEFSEKPHLLSTVRKSLWLSIISAKKGQDGSWSGAHPQEEAASTTPLCI